MASQAEPCIGCGEHTGVGSPFYSDRRAVKVEPGKSAYLCVLCAAELARGRRPARMTEDEVDHLVKNGSVAFIAASGGIH